MRSENPNRPPLIADTEWYMKDGYWIFLIFLLGAFLRFYDLSGRQLWLDELIGLARFSHPTLRECLLDIRGEVAAVPLDYMVQRVFLQLWGLREFTARFHAAFFGTASLLAIYWFARSLFSRQTALWSAFLLAVYPLHVFYSQEGRNYSLFFFLTLCATGFLLKALRTGASFWWFAYALTMLADLYTNYLATAVLLLHGILVALLVLTTDRLSGEWTGDKNGRRMLLPFLLCAVSALLLFLPWLLWTIESTKRAQPNPFLEGTLFLRIFKEISGGSYPLSIVLFVLFAAGVRSLVQSRHWQRLSLLGIWLFGGCLAVLVLDAWRGYFFAIRQILFATPALICGASEGIVFLISNTRMPRRRLLVQCTVLILIATLGIGTHALRLKKDQADWKGLCRYLDNRVSGEDRIAAPLIEHVVAFLYPQMHRRNLDLESLLQKKPDTGFRRLHLIESIYQPPELKAEISKVMAAYRLQSTIELKGFRIYLLSLESSPAEEK